MDIDKSSLPPVLDYEPLGSLEPTGYAWLVVGLLFVVAVLNYLDRLMITTMLEPIRAEFTIDNRSISLFTSVFLWIYAIVSPFGGFLADRFSRSAVIIASLFFWSAATCVSGFAHSYHQLLFARGLMGVSEACYMPAALALIADYHRGRTRSSATGFHMAGIYTGAALGGLGGFLAEYLGWRFGFKIFGLFGIGYAVVLLLFLRDQSERRRGRGRHSRWGRHSCLPESASGGIPAPRADSNRRGQDKNVPALADCGQARMPASLGSAPEYELAGHAPGGIEPQLGKILLALLASPGFRILFVVNVLVGIFNWSIYAWLPTYLKERFHLGLGASGLSATFYVQCASFAGVLLAGYWADRWTKTNRRARSLVPAIGFCIAGPCLMGAGSTGILLFAIMALIVVGLGRGSFDANHMPILRELVDQRYSATGFGVLNLISTAAGGGMVYAAGALRDAKFNLSLVFQGCGVAMLLAGLLLLYLGTTGESQGSPAP